MPLGPLFPDWDGPGTPFEIVDAAFWGPAFAVPLNDVPTEVPSTALFATLVAIESTGNEELDRAVANAIAFDLSTAIHRPAHAGSLRHALTAALFFLGAYANTEAGIMLRYRQDGISPPTGVATTVFTPALVFSAGAAVLQMRASLDALAAAAADEGLNFHGRSSYGKLRSRLKKWSDPRAIRLLPLVDQFSPRHAELEKIRNRIAHPVPNASQHGFGTFALLPHLPTHTAGFVGLPQYEGKRAKAVLVELEEAVRGHIRDVLEVLWG